MSSGVEFEEDSFGSNSFRQPTNSPAISVNPTSLVGRFQVARETKGMTGWFIRHNLADSPESAQKVMIGVVILNIIITVLVYIFFL